VRIDRIVAEVDSHFGANRQNFASISIHLTKSHKTDAEIGAPFAVYRQKFAAIGKILPRSPSD